MRAVPVLLAALALALGGAPPAARADWLVTRDGSRVETEGRWEVKGRLVVFTRAGGGLASLRLADVDLDASAAATEAATESAREEREAAAVTTAAPEPGKRRPPVLVLTDADVGPAIEAAEEAPAAAAGSAATGFTVSDWDRLADEVSGEATVVGELRNVGREDRPAPSLVVSVYGADGVELASVDAVVEASVIPARESARFRASFPGLVSFAAAKFQITAAPAAPAAEPSPEAPEAGGDEPAAG